MSGFVPLTGSLRDRGTRLLLRLVLVLVELVTEGARVGGFDELEQTRHCGSS